MPRYIDADALKDVIQQHDYLLSDKLNSIGNGMFTLGIFQAIDQMPTVSPDDVRGVGEWTRHVLKNANTPWGYDCSACGEWFVIGGDTAERYNYCPNCGARMKGVSEDA